ncbi:MAG: pyridoxamine 5'-phosphate oxidase family protein [Eubacteriales bacterium]
MMQIDFPEAKRRLFDAIRPAKIMVLATSENDKVTARSMSCIVMNEKIYFQTDKTFLKYQQIKSNKNVALCFSNVQIEGHAHEMGHPMDSQNNGFAELFEKHYKDSFDAYTHLENEVLIEVDITNAVIWGYEGDRQYREFIDFKDKKAEKQYYIKE